MGACFQGRSKEEQDTLKNYRLKKKKDQEDEIINNTKEKYLIRFGTRNTRADDFKVLEPGEKKELEHFKQTL